MEDRQIVELYWRREETAIAETRAAYGWKLRRLAYGILKNDEDAEETENDTYFKAWNAIPPRRPAHLLGFLAKICRRTALDRLDWNQAQKRNAELVELTDEMEQCIPDRLAEEHFASEELGRIITAFLEPLPAEHRQMFLRRYFLGESIHELAHRFRASESKVKSSLYRMRVKLKTYLEKEGVSV